MKIQSQRSDQAQIYTEDGVITISYSLTFDAKARKPNTIAIEGSTVTARFDGLGSIVDSIRGCGETVTLTRRWRIDTEGSYRLQSGFDYDNGRDKRLFIPALWYEDNLKGTGVFPSSKIATTWSFLETRMSVPCCGQLSDGVRLFTCATEAAIEARFLASLTADRHGFIISIPGSEWPYSYRGKKSLVDTSEEALPTLAVGREGLSYERTFYLSIQKERDSLKGYTSFIASLPKQGEAPPTPPLDWLLWAEYKLTRLLNLVHKSDDGLAYLIMGEGNGEVQAVYNFTAASFLVKSLQAAHEMATLTAHRPVTEALHAARRRLASLFSLEDDELLLAHTAKRIGDFFLQAEEESGFFLDNHDLESGAWGGYLGIGEHPQFKEMANSRCNGEAMKHYVLLSRRLNELGIKEEAYLPLAKRVARFYTEAQLSGGSFGRWWTAKGKPADTQGTNGAYIGSFFCTLVTALDDDDPLKADLESALHRAYGHYGQLANEGAFYGDTLDADSCDKEAGVALLSFFLDLYEMDGDKRHLESATLAARFIVQWIWQQDSYLDPESPLGVMGFSTRGMTSVSVAHHHLDFYGMAIAYEFLRYSSHTGDDFFRAQARLMIEACRQLVATPDKGYGRDASFIGWQAEQLNHTAWEYFNRPSLMGGHFDIDIAWVTVLTLGAYLLIRDGFGEMVE